MDHNNNTSAREALVSLVPGPTTQVRILAHIASARPHAPRRRSRARFGSLPAPCRPVRARPPGRRPPLVARVSRRPAPTRAHPMAARFIGGLARAILRGFGCLFTRVPSYVRHLVIESFSITRSDTEASTPKPKAACKSPKTSHKKASKAERSKAATRFKPMAPSPEEAPSSTLADDAASRPVTPEAELARVTPEESAASARAFLRAGDTRRSHVFANKFKAETFTVSPEDDVTAADPAEWRLIGSILCCPSKKKAKGAIVLETSDGGDVFGLVDGERGEYGTVTAITAKSVTMRDEREGKRVFFPWFTRMFNDPAPLEPLPEPMSASATLKDSELPVTEKLSNTLLDLESSGEKFAAAFVRTLDYDRIVELVLTDRLARGAIPVFVGLGTCVYVAWNGGMLVDFLDGTCISVSDGQTFHTNMFIDGYDDTYGELYEFAHFERVTAHNSTLSVNGTHDLVVRPLYYATKVIYVDSFSRMFVPLQKTSINSENLGI